MKVESRMVLPMLKDLPLPVKVLFTSMILLMAVAMAGAMGQVIVHDIIPTFFSEENTTEEESRFLSDRLEKSATSKDRDIFGDMDIPESDKMKQPYYVSEQFVWLLKWSHIHLFGMSMIFILMGIITVFLNLSSVHRAWMVALPFAGILVDITAIWLKTYISSSFFWLHIPGGGLFGAVFIYVSVKSLWEMWLGTCLMKNK